jgi:3-keto-5-aminohexanoate cleavage enzyme
MTTPCIVTVAITASPARMKDNPAVLITVSEPVASTQEGFACGATLVHLHGRNDDESPTSNADRFAAVLDGIKRHCPGIITQVSTGGRSGAGRERGAMLALAADLDRPATSRCRTPTGTRARSNEKASGLCCRTPGQGCPRRPEV